MYIHACIPSCVIHIVNIIVIRKKLKQSLLILIKENYFLILININFKSVYFLHFIQYGTGGVNQNTETREANKSYLGTRQNTEVVT